MAKKKNKNVSTNTRLERLAYLTAEEVREPLGRKKQELVKDAGYSPKTKYGDIVARTENFPELVKKYLPDEQVLARHMQLIEQDDDKKVSKDSIKLYYELTGRLNKKQEGFNAFINSISIDTGSYKEEGKVIDSE